MLRVAENKTGWYGVCYYHYCSSYYCYNYCYYYCYYHYRPRTRPCPTPARTAQYRGGCPRRAMIPP